MWTTRKHPGFTIVELLIVVVVIGILAAIVIVAYNGITNSANNSAVKSDFATLAKKMELYKTSSSSGQYPMDATQLNDANFKVSQGSYAIVNGSGNPRNNLYYCHSNDGLHYAFGAESKGGLFYYVVDGQVEETTSNISGDSTCSQAGGPSGTWERGYDSASETWRTWTE